MSDKQIKIVSGEEARPHLGDRELIHLTNRVNKMEVAETVGYIRHAIAGRIHQLLSGRGKQPHPLVRRIDRAFGPIEHMKALRERGDIAVATHGEKAVGMAGFELCGEDSRTGRNVYEVRRIAVQQKFEGHGIGGELHKTIFEKVRSIDPNALIIVEAQNPKVSAQCRKMGYKPCTLAEGLRLKYGDAELDEWIAYYEKIGGEFFVYDPATEHH
jgi:GNAT superfamily N-acetyltransferase